MDEQTKQILKTCSRVLNSNDWQTRVKGLTDAWSGQFDIFKNEDVPSPFYHLKHLTPAKFYDGKSVVDAYVNYNDHLCIKIEEKVFDYPNEDAPMCILHEKNPYNEKTHLIEFIAPHGFDRGHRKAMVNYVINIPNEISEDIIKNLPIEKETTEILEATLPKEYFDHFKDRLCDEKRVVAEVVREIKKKSVFDKMFRR